MKPKCSIMDWMYGYEIQDKVQGVDIGFSTPHSMIYQPRMGEKTQIKIGKITATKNFGSEGELNSFLRSITENPQKMEEELDKAQATKKEKDYYTYMELVSQAWQTRGFEASQCILKSLLYTDKPVDALIWIALHIAKKTFEEDNLLIKAQKIAKDSIKKEHWAKFDGKFWDMLETRPYMRAKACYADFLWMDMFQEESAIQILEELLLLDTMDRMGLRFILMSWYLSKENYEKMSNLYTTYSKDRNNPLFLYPLALMNYIQSGSHHPTTHEIIQKALISNIRIGSSLLLEEDPDPTPPPYYIKHSPEEAKYFLELDQGVWYEKEGILDWLQDEFDQLTKMILTENQDLLQ